MKLEKLQYEFSAEKNKSLIKDRSISFEAIISAINNGSLLDILEHPNKTKYPNQQIYVVNMDGYIYLVPFVKINAETIFLKTIFPSRKLNKQYLNQEGINDETT
jgi:uncharacterized DUF497 family protein